MPLAEAGAAVAVSLGLALFVAPPIDCPGGVLVDKAYTTPMAKTRLIKMNQIRADVFIAGYLYYQSKNGTIRGLNSNQLDRDDDPF